MVTVKTRAPLTVYLLLLWLAVPLSPSGPSQAGATQYLSTPEVVIPLKVTTRGRGAETPGWLSYSLQLEGHRHIVHMRPKKQLVSPDLPVFTYTEQHALHEDHPFIPGDCYYHGYVEGAPESLVVFSICFGGFRGVLHISGLNYEIEPIRHSTSFEHLAYRLYANETRFSPAKCALTEKEVAHQHLRFEGMENSGLKQNASGDWWTHTWFLELAIVTDHAFFTYSQSNLSNVQENVILVINIVDSVYHQLNTFVTLIGIVIWNQGNAFSMTDIEQVLEDFSQWKQFSLSKLQHDAAHIFIKSSISTLGLAYVGGICHPPINCGVDNFQGDPWSLFANTVAHELGHTFGMQHDEKFCSCGETGCIMSAFRVPAQRFTNCSYDTFQKTTLNQGSCLHTHPRPGGVFWLKRCGNGVIERGEECDCGSVQQCKQDPCCMLNCTLKPEATCAFGLCCKDCKFMPLGELCRQQVNECDLPEWCNGTSHQCPEDGYVQDGIPCSATAYCYQKQCNTHDQQCKEIFGKGAKRASQNCYEEINSQGSQVGHCGKNGTVYLKCNLSDILCGRVQCDNVENVPLLRDHSVLQQTRINGVTCWGIKHYFGHGIPDFGEVKDGTSCGAGKICIHKKCVSLSVLSQVCLPETCNMKGICNNKHHCHCTYGWSPPHCLNRGYGGSEDSGPASAKTRVFLSGAGFLWGSSLIGLLAIGICVYCQIHFRPR